MSAPTDNASISNYNRQKRSGAREGRNVILWQKCRNFSRIFVDFLKKVRIISSCMDTKNDCRIPECGNLDVLKAGRIVVGAKQLCKALGSGRARLVFLAENADPALTGPIEALCQQNHVSYAWVRSMQELGRACGIEVGAAAAAAVD